MKIGIEIGHDEKYLTSVNGWVRSSWYITVSIPCRVQWDMEYHWGWKSRTWRWYHGNV
jgi:hypothetical protein